MAKVKIKIRAKPAAPKDDPRRRMVQDVQAETARLLSAVDQKKKYGTVKGLGQVQDILRATYTLIDLAEEGR
jgi:hypothetical protein